MCVNFVKEHNILGKSSAFYTPQRGKPIRWGKAGDEKRNTLLRLGEVYEKEQIHTEVNGKGLIIIIQERWVF